MINAHEIVTAPDATPHRTAFVLHGILGSRGNWRGFGRGLVAAHPEWRVVLVDLRGHGESHGAKPPHTVAACAADLNRLARHIGHRPEAIIGHSFGGKVALTYAREHGARLKAAWSLDSPPGIQAIDGEVGHVIETARALPTPAADRKAVVAHFTAAGLSEGIGRWMTTNLRRTADGFVWRFDLDVIDALLADYAGLDLFPFLENPPPGLALHLVLAGRSNRWKGEAGRRVRGLERVAVHGLPDAGHWVHIDDPEGLRALLGATLG